MIGKLGIEKCAIIDGRDSLEPAPTFARGHNETNFFFTPDADIKRLRRTTYTGANIYSNRAICRKAGGKPIRAKAGGLEFETRRRDLDLHKSFGTLRSNTHPSRTSRSGIHAQRMQ